VLFLVPSFAPTKEGTARAAWSAYNKTKINQSHKGWETEKRYAYRMKYRLGNPTKLKKIPPIISDGFAVGNKPQVRRRRQTSGSPKPPRAASGALPAPKNGAGDKNSHKPPGRGGKIGTKSGQGASAV
jgi:hypothetical protein